MESIGFEGTIRALRRGGWAARGLIVSNRHGQLVETQVGPKAFDSEGNCYAWLRAEADDRKIENVRIVAARIAGRTR